jgi:hypothetical protein
LPGWVFLLSSFFYILYSFVPAGASVAQVHLSVNQKACHSELVEESAREVAAHASAIEFSTRWKRT